MAPKVNASHFETLYEVLWNYSVTLRILSKQHETTTLNPDTLDQHSRSVFREVFYAELLSTLIVMFERKERRERTKGRIINMLTSWQDDGSRKVLARELFAVARKNGHTKNKSKEQVVAEIKAELNTIFELSVHDMYKMVCDGPEAITELLRGVVKVARMNLPQEDTLLCSKLVKLRNKINFLIAIVENYGDQEETGARQQLKRDMMEGFSFNTKSKSVDDFSGESEGPAVSHFRKERRKVHRKSSRERSTSSSSKISSASSGSQSSGISIMDMEPLLV